MCFDMLSFYIMAANSAHSANEERRTGQDFLHRASEGLGPRLLVNSQHGTSVWSFELMRKS